MIEARIVDFICFIFLTFKIYGKNHTHFNKIFNDQMPTIIKHKYKT